MPQHSILQKLDKHLEGTSDPYDLNVINSNIDYDQWGYLLKIAYMHFLSPVPQWILDVQQAYHSEKTANKKGKETRDKLDKPEGVIKELQKIAQVGSQAALNYIPYSAAQFGAILKHMHVELLGENIFETGEGGLQEGTIYWDNYRIFLAIFGKFLTRGFGVSNEDTTQFVDDEEPEEADEGPPTDASPRQRSFARPEDIQVLKSSAGSSTKADEGQIFVQYYLLHLTLMFVIELLQWGVTASATKGKPATSTTGGRTPSSMTKNDGKTPLKKAKTSSGQESRPPSARRNPSVPDESSTPKCTIGGSGGMRPKKQQGDAIGKNLYISYTELQ